MAIGKLDWDDSANVVLHDDAALTTDPRGNPNPELEDQNAPPDNQEYLTQRMGKMERAIQDAQLMTVPGVADLLRAQQNGQKVRVMTEADIAQLMNQGKQQTREEPETEPDWENLSLKDAVPVMQKKLLGQLIPALKETINEMLQPVIGKVEGFGNEIEKHKQNTLAEEVAQMVKKFPDFPTYKEKMMELHNSHPTLTIRQLYSLAKSEAGHLPPTQNTVSERPTSNTARPPLRGNQPAKPVVGRQNFRNTLSEALKTMDTSGFPDNGR